MCVLCSTEHYAKIWLLAFSLEFQVLALHQSGPSFGGLHTGVAIGFEVRPFGHFWGVSEILLHPQSGLCVAFTERGA